jgi:glycolate oxidase FAD binding subunit
MNMLAALTLEQSMAQLASIVGPEHAHVHTHFSNEAIIVAPANEREIAEILRFANASELIVAPTGGGTKLGWGNPVAPSIWLSLKRINAFRTHAWQDMTCTVEAGCTWAAMQAELTRHGQTVALDPIWPERATVGGIVAANDSGALRLKYGGLRDLIIGMTIVLADGTVAKSGGKVVKNVAGYDLHKLMTGSFGTLGVIAEINFRLHPREEHARTWTAVVPNLTLVDAPLRALLDSQMTPSSVQLRSSKRECALDIRIAGLPECLDEYAARMENIFGQIAVSESGESVWQARQQLFDENDAVVLKVSLLPAQISPVTLDLQQWAATDGINIATVAQATGLMIVAVKSSPDAAIAIIARLRARLRSSGGSVVALKISDAMRDSLDVWDCNSDALPLMHEIKRRFDSKRILNPGRFVGRI